MAFWGVEIKPGNPFSHRFDTSRGRLHISQATLGFGTSLKKSLVQCNVGDKAPILLCSLTPDKTESCPLDLEFEEVDEEVVFSVLGPQSVHLTGYYLGSDSHACGHDDDDSDSYGEDIAETASEDESMDYDSDDDDYEDDFIDDDDPEMYQPSTKRKSGVVIEEIVDDEKPTNGDRKRLKKKYQISDSDDDSQMQIIVRGSIGMSESESEDEDGLPKSSLSKGKVSNKNAEVEDKSEKKVGKGRNKAENGGEQLTGLKRKKENGQDVETERGVEQLKDSTVPASEVQPENDDTPKKKKKKRTKKAKTLGAEDDRKPDISKEDKAQSEEKMTDSIDQDHPDKDETEEKRQNDKSVGENKGDLKKKKKKKKKKTTTKTPDIEEEKKGEVKPKQIRSYSNGLVVEELQMGKPDGKRASPGNKVSVHYIGKLKNNGKIFESNVGSAPFKFRLGVGEVIPGWDVGVNGMRIGDKRRITIPPSMGYGDKGAGGKIPPKAWLVFDVELVNAH